MVTFSGAIGGGPGIFKNCSLKFSFEFQIKIKIEMKLVQLILIK
jgi:hypothetical protein